MCPRYTFDSANTLTFPSRFHKWWSTFYGYSESPARRVEVRLVANINYTLEKYFIHKKPSKDILCDMKTGDGHLNIPELRLGIHKAWIFTDHMLGTR